MTEAMGAGFPLSPQQKYVWSLQRDGRPLATELVLAIDGRLDQARLRNALQQVVLRHEILRTIFQRRAGMKFPLQVIVDDPKFHWEERSISAADPGALKSIVESIFTSLTASDLGQLPVLRASVAAIGDDRNLLLFSVPALCADIASLRNLAREIAALYAEPGAELPEVFQYADYSEWANDLLQKQDAEQAKSFWKEQDRSDVPPVCLPFEKKQPNAAAASQSVPVSLDSSLLAASVNLHPRTEQLLLACWQILLSRLTGQAEIVSTYLADGRNHDELKSAVGAFAKPLPLYLNFEEIKNVQAVIDATAQLMTAATEWEDYFSPERLERPLIGFGADYAIEPVTAAAVNFSEYSASTVTSGSHLHLHCASRGGRWTITLSYDENCFDRSMVEQLAGRLAILVQAAIASPNSAATLLPLMDEGERQRVLSFSKTEAPYPTKTVHELFERQAACNPNRPALRFMDSELSYAELNAESNRIAHYLRNRGVKSNVAVGLCVERSAEMIVGLLGILKAGGCYVPLVPDNPKARLAHQLSETAAPVLLTQEKLLDRLPEFAGEIICLDRDRARMQHEPDANPEIMNTPDDLVYIIYTSGSTGVPKGVAVRHRSLVNYSQFIAERIKLADAAEGLNFATVSTISADLGNTCVFPALIFGGCLHVISYETAMSPDLFANYAAQHPIDVLKITPSHLNALLQGKEGENVLPRKYLLLGGEAFPWDLLQRIRRAGKCRVFNHYGPTEATVGCCTFSADDTDVSAWAPATVPIGSPVANDEVYILDQQLQPTPVGVAGELCVGGAGLAQGYLNRPLETAERFIAHPFSKRGNERLYRTGDLARFLPTGDIEFLGRIDHQVKIRGFRVEPAEIESLLRTHPAVQEVVTIAYPDKSGDNQLAAYVVSRKPAAADELRQYLQQQLPDYMIPGALVFLDRLPLTANGKVDRRSLPSPHETKVEREFVPPRNPEEEKLVAIWMEVLKLDRVSVLDNFFELGGHSLLATQIISRVRNTFRVQLPLHGFLETPTIAALAEKIVQSPAAESEDEEIARLLQELEGMSEEEAERLLASQAEESAGGNGEAKTGKASG